MTLVHNERTKLLANALDRASTACIAAGLIAPVVSAMNGAPALQVSWIAILSSIIWLFCCFYITYGSKARFGEAETMNSAAIFFFFILPFVIAALGWVVVFVNDWNDRRQQRLPPGE